MNNDVRGLEAVLSFKKHFQPEQLLQGIPVQNFQMYMPWCIISSAVKGLSYSQPITLSFLQDLSETNCIWEQVLHFFPHNEDARRLRDYEDFLNSTCQCSILFYDCAYLEIYVKCNEWLNTFQQNIMKMHPVSFCIKTDETDTRTEFL